MRKDLKEKLINHNYTLYQQEWIEHTATDGFNRMLKGLKEKEPTLATAMEKCLWPFEIVYYTAFEDALNTFIYKVLEDEMHDVSIYLDELHKITASIHKKK